MTTVEILYVVLRKRLWALGAINTTNENRVPRPAFLDDEEHAVNFAATVDELAGTLSPATAEWFTDLRAQYPEMSERVQPRLLAEAQAAEVVLFDGLQEVAVDADALIHREVHRKLRREEDRACVSEGYDDS